MTSPKLHSLDPHLKKLKSDLKIIEKYTLKKHQKSQDQVQQNQERAVKQQIFDAFLISHSPLYQKSRELFLKQGGGFLPSLLNSRRSLSGIHLLSSEIQYTPHQNQILWALEQKLLNKESIFEQEFIRKIEVL